MKYLKWTDQLCHEALEIMNQYPHNLQSGFDECAKRFNKSSFYFRNAWYNPKYRLCQFRTSKQSLLCTSLGGIIPNNKVIHRNSKKFKTTKPIPITKDYFISWVSNCTR